MGRYEHQQKVEQHRGQPGNAGQFGSWPASESQATLPAGADVMRGATGVQQGVNPLAGTGSLAFPPPIESTADAVHFGATVDVDDVVCQRLVDHDDAAHREARIEIRRMLIEDHIRQTAAERYNATKKPWYRDENEHWQRIYSETDAQIGDQAEMRAKELSDQQLDIRPQVHRGNVQAVVRAYAMVANAPKVQDGGSVRFEDPEMLSNTRLMCDGVKRPVIDIYDDYVDGRDDVPELIGMPRRDSADVLDRMNQNLLAIAHNTEDIRVSAERTERYAQVTAQNSEAALHEARRQSLVLAANVNAQMAAQRELRTLRHYADDSEQRRLEAQSQRW